jgi:hypothetical protein
MPDANGTAAPSIFTGGVSLATTFGALPVAVQNALIATAQSFGISTAGIDEQHNAPSDPEGDGGHFPEEAIPL